MDMSRKEKVVIYASTLVIVLVCWTVIFAALTIMAQLLVSFILWEWMELSPLYLRSVTALIVILTLVSGISLSDDAIRRRLFNRERGWKE